MHRIVYSAICKVFGRMGGFERGNFLEGEVDVYSRGDGILLVGWYVHRYSVEILESTAFYFSFFAGLVEKRDKRMIRLTKVVVHKVGDCSTDVARFCALQIQQE